MATTTGPIRTLRSFELFDIEWSNGSTWTGYDTEAEAQRVASSPGIIDRTGTVVRRTWEIELDERMLAAGMYQPGCGDRVVR